MKTKIPFFVIFVVAFLSSLSVFAQIELCPEGWSYSSETYVDPNGCEWQIDFCYKCPVIIGGELGGSIKVLNYHLLNPAENGCMAPDQEWATNRIISTYFSLCTIPPCSEGCLKIVSEWPLCAQWYTFGWRDLQGNYHYHNWLGECLDGDFCQRTSKKCRNADGYIVPCAGWLYDTYGIIEGGGYCQVEQIPAPPPPQHDFEGEQITSVCFRYIGFTCP
ncbi:MAG: hypothetical protein HZB41_15190 [Ignavibacteriae bacterium]|nr:hypothetical protein [Ignavibacteriota bacterium]